MRDQVRISVETVLPDGLIFASRSAPSDRSPGGYSRSRRVHEIRGAEGEPGPAVDTFPGSEWYSHPDEAGSSWVPFSRDVSTLAWGGHAVVAVNDSYEISAFGADGTLRRIVRREHDLIPTTPAHLDAYIERPRTARRALCGHSARASRELPRHAPPGHPPGVPQSPGRRAGPPLGSGVQSARRSGAQSDLDGLRPRGTGPGASWRPPRGSSSIRSARTTSSAPPRTNWVWNTCSCGR